MAVSFPFYLDLPEKDGQGVYHTHPRCRIAQSISQRLHVAGKGQGRRQCPFCFVMSQFEASHAMKTQLPADARAEFLPRQESGSTAASGTP
jgi:hypothetical protein